MKIKAPFFGKLKHTNKYGKKNVSTGGDAPISRENGELERKLKLTQRTGNLYEMRKFRPTKEHMISCNYPKNFGKGMAMEAEKNIRPAKLFWSDGEQEHGKIIKEYYVCGSSAPRTHSGNDATSQNETQRYGHDVKKAPLTQLTIGEKAGVRKNIERRMQ